MELAEFIKFLKKYWRMLFRLTLCGCLFGFLISLGFPVRYNASATLYIKRIPEKSQLGDYSYDGYYAQQAAEAFTDTVAGFLQSRDLLKGSIQESNLSPEDLESYSRRLKVEKVAPQLIAVSITLPSAKEANDLIVALIKSTQKQLQSFDEEKPAFLMGSISPEPLIKEVKPRLALNSIVAGGTFLLVTFAWLLLREYLKNGTAQ